MKIIDKILMTAVVMAGTAMLTGCDIEPKDRFVELPAIKIERTALLMDFTGQRCVNCPAAHEVMEELKRQYGEALITVSIHGGGLAISTDRTDFSRNSIGLMIQEGNEMNDAFGINQWPMGVVDRINANGAAINSGLWATAVRDALEKPTDVSITAEAEIVDNNKIRVITTSRDNADSQRDLALQVWVVEDLIQARQETPDGRVPDYTHNNVLRYVSYPVKSGLPLKLSKGIDQDTETVIDVKWTDKERWNIDNLSVVAFISQGTEIQNAVRVKVENNH